MEILGGENMSINYIYDQLMEKYYNYYCTVYYEFILEAIKNTLDDFKNKKSYNITDIHENIKNNYI